MVNDICPLCDTIAEGAIDSHPKPRAREQNARLLLQRDRRKTTTSTPQEWTLPVRSTGRRRTRTQARASQNRGHPGRQDSQSGTIRRKLLRRKRRHCRRRVRCYPKVLRCRTILPHRERRRPARTPLRTPPTGLVLTPASSL